MTKWVALSGRSHTCKSPSIIYSPIKIEDRSHMIISTDAEKSFYKVPMISVLEKLEITIMYFKLIKTMYIKAIVNIVLNINNLKDFFLISGG